MAGSGQAQMPQAQTGQAPNPHAGHHMPASTNSAASTKAYEAANEKMHKDMAISFSGDADVDFVKGMIPHHQGAIDMAKVVLAHGKDAQIRKLAEEVIKAQEGEIAMMRDWLKKKGVQ
ncbi:MAG: CopM family metallochaperone [Beijerinckiaceae bacterium]